MVLWVGSCASSRLHSLWFLVPKSNVGSRRLGNGRGRRQKKWNKFRLEQSKHWWVSDDRWYPDPQHPGYWIFTWALSKRPYVCNGWGPLGWSEQSAPPRRGTPCFQLWSEEGVRKVESGGVKREYHYQRFSKSQSHDKISFLIWYSPPGRKILLSSSI